MNLEPQPQEPQGLDEQLRSFWELESLGVQKDEKTLYDEFATPVSFGDHWYKVSLPLKEFHEPLFDSYFLNVGRLQGLLCRLRQDPVILKEYDRTIKDQLEKDIIKVDPEGQSKPAQTHYLPYHTVVRHDRSTTKLHVVYDAFAKSDGPLLNECLHKGPKYNRLILDLLLWFWSNRVALNEECAHKIIH